MEVTLPSVPAGRGLQMLHRVQGHPPPRGSGLFKAVFIYKSSSWLWTILCGQTWVSALPLTVGVTLDEISHS